MITQKGNLCEGSLSAWILVFVLYTGLVVPPLQAAAPNLQPAEPELGSKVDDSRGHCLYSLEAVRGLLADEETVKNVPRQTGGHTRVLGRNGTVRSEVYGLLLTHRGNRVRFLEVMDFETCEGLREVALLRPRGRKEALIIRTSLMEQCDGTLEKWWAGFAAAAEKGKEAVKEFASVGTLTVETSSLRAVLSLEEWERDGHPDIGESLSPEFWVVIKEEVLPLTHLSSAAVTVSRFLGGLLDEGWPETAEIPPCDEGPPDCDFDAEFDVPCTPGQQRAFEDRRRGGELIDR